MSFGPSDCEGVDASPGGARGGESRRLTRGSRAGLTRGMRFMGFDMGMMRMNINRRVVCMILPPVTGFV